ncbi:MAG TPA: glycosyltransferase family 2 protein [Bacteroidales bacterium]|nr:glycosyltransferase family 2 protein [Bacteroidales bacterium]HOU96675.1 glycosyltransferase family 2 protein [Bacteroidales bacterium]HQJ20559.1 glycosyltransferase family 2 protein [Bacteroidales bacterium]
MLSVVIPIYNEEDVLEELIRRTVSAIESFIDNYEIIFVDDGSSDKSLDLLLSFRNKNPRIKILSLSRNFGHQIAYTAGLEHASGDIVAMMDGDLQDPPEMLPEMYKKIYSEGYDVINGRKKARKENLQRKIFMSIFHFLFKKIAGLNNIANAGNFSMMRRCAVNAIISFGENMRYLPGIRSYVGFKQGFVDYVRDERFTGKSKMSMKKLLILAGDAIFSFSKFPLQVCYFLGIIGVVVFMVAGIYILVAQAAHLAVPGWSSTLLSIYFLGSVQLIFLGIIGEYVYRSYKESQNRPLYFVKNFYGGTFDA